MLLQDDRDYQILFLSIFLILGIGTRDWTLRPDLILVVILTCLGTQWLMSVVSCQWQSLRHSQANLSESRRWSLPRITFRSALITALSLCLLLRANHYTTMALASSLAILSKFLFQVRGKHFFNPANFGIIAVLILTPDAWGEGSLGCGTPRLRKEQVC